MTATDLRAARRWLRRAEGLGHTAACDLRWGRGEPPLCTCPGRVAVVGLELARRYASGEANARSAYHRVLQGGKL